ncbi:MAG TPA: hypothetical protein VM779_13165, partial [Thermoanaerobaculia bacterium]|nr:hypothetical protein [Thermoanaerobaculia bacterium]
MTGQDGRYRRKPFKRTIRNAHCRPLVTVCIAAVKYSPEPTIVAVSDMMLTGADNYKYESAVIKAFQLDGFDRWHVLFANLPCAFVAVWRETVKQLSPMEAPPRVADVRSAIQGAYSAEIGTIIER